MTRGQSLGALPTVDVPSSCAYNCNKEAYSVHALVRRNTLATQEVHDSIEHTDGKPSDESLRRVLSWTDLIAYGISSTIGSGIYVVLGQVAQGTAGPATLFSFVIAAISSLLSAFCYAEFAARVPLSGSAYTFSYVVLGELIGWFIGWNLTLEYAISASAVARSWSSYVVEIFSAFGVTVPNWVYNIEVSSLIVLSPLSLVIIVLCTLVLLFGIKSGAIFNNIITLLNLGIIVFIIICGSVYWESDNLFPDFFPFGFQGIMSGAGTVFFSYIGFDSITTLAGEVKNPTRDLPIGIMGTIALVTALYMAVTLVLCAMVPYASIGLNAPLADAFVAVGNNWAAKIVAIGAATTLSATTFASLLGQPRIFLQMAKDGLLFEIFGRVNPTTGTPVFGTLISAGFAAFFAFLLPLKDLTDMISIGTLMAFTIVCAGIVVLRYQDDEHPVRVPAVVLLFIVFASFSAFSVAFSFPIWAIALYAVGPIALFLTIFMFKRRTDLPVVFQCPFVPWVPCAGIYINMLLIVSLSPASWERVFLWTIVGLVIYFGYGIRYSRQGAYERRMSAVQRGTVQGSGSAVVGHAEKATTVYGSIY